LFGVKRLVAVAVLLLAGCASKPPPLLPPDRVESFCGDVRPDGAELAAILSSVADRIEPSVPYPGDDAVRFDVTHNGGAIGTWAQGQPLYMPVTDQALGVTGSYLTVRRLAIDNQLSGTESRLIYATVDTPQGLKSIVLRAYDVTNICRAAGTPAADAT
jgi:hypothetical protein